MKNLGDAPKPFAQEAQYKKKFNKDKVDDPDAGELLTPKGPGKSSSKSKMKKLRPTIQNVKNKKGTEPTASSENVYKPHEYSRIRKEFIDSKKDSGLSSKDAAEAWNQSQQKRKLLGGVPLPELRRRRFIPMGCDSNPWAS